MSNSGSDTSQPAWKTRHARQQSAAARDHATIMRRCDLMDFQLESSAEMLKQVLSAQALIMTQLSLDFPPEPKSSTTLMDPLLFDIFEDEVDTATRTTQTDYNFDSKALDTNSDNNFDREALDINSDNNFDSEALNTNSGKSFDSEALNTNSDNNLCSKAWNSDSGKSLDSKTLDTNTDKNFDGKALDTNTDKNFDGKALDTNSDKNFEGKALDTNSDKNFDSKALNTNSDKNLHSTALDTNSPSKAWDAKIERVVHALEAHRSWPPQRPPTVLVEKIKRLRLQPGRETAWTALADLNRNTRDPASYNQEALETFISEFG